MASPPQPSPDPSPSPSPMPPPPSPPQNPPLPTPDNSTTTAFSPPPPENPNPPSPPPSNHVPSDSPPNNHLPLPSPPFSPSRLAIVLRSPEKPSTSPGSNPNPNSCSNNAPSSGVTIGSLLATTTDLSVSKKAAANGLGSSKRMLLAPNPWKFKKGELKRYELGLRVSALVLCATSLSIMAADTVPGWAGDSFVRYQEYRYLLSVNVVGFLYSAFQFSAEVHQIFTRRNFIGHPIGYCFSLAMDQILAYMLVSASSAATSQNYIWMSRFGGDSFTKLINASVSMSFLAFFCVAFSSVISAYHLFSSIS